MSKTRRIWLYLFKHYSIADIPKPFPLPRPLHHCSSRDLEELVCRYFFYLRNPPIRVARVRTFSPRRPIWEGRLLPGGRWTILSRQDGSLLYVDCYGENSKAHTLIPPPPGWRTGTEVFVSFSIDIDTSCETLAFNIAWAIRQKLGANVGEYRHEVQIWSVAVDFDDSWEAIGLSATKLASFPEDPFCSIDHCSLRGDLLAYRQNSFLTLVDWREANGTKRIFPRRVFQCPGVRIQAYCWRDTDTLISLGLSGRLIALASHSSP